MATKKKADPKKAPPEARYRVPINNEVMFFLKDLEGDGSVVQHIRIPAFEKPAPVPIPDPPPPPAPIPKPPPPPPPVEREKMVAGELLQFGDDEERYRVTSVTRHKDGFDSVYVEKVYG